MLKVGFMGFLFLAMVSGSIFYSGSKQKPKQEKTFTWDRCDSTNSLYMYKDEAIDLETLQWVTIDGTPAYTFQSCSRYKTQFTDDKNTFNAVPCLLVDDAAPGKQAGEISLKDSLLTFTLHQTNVAQVFTLPQNIHDNSCVGIIKDKKLVIATWHSIATGSALYCFDLERKSLAWKADVTQLMAYHSKYYNRIFLTLYKDKVIMEGAEGAGRYLQIFDLATGKKLFEHMR